MATETIFTTIDLPMGGKCEVIDMRTRHIWAASFRHIQYNMVEGQELDLVPFVLEQILIIKGKKRDIEYIGDMAVDDYLAIADAVNAVLAKIPGF